MSTFKIPKEAVEYLAENGFKSTTNYLAKLRCVGGGPVFRKFGSRVVYSEEDLTAWVNSQLSEPMENTSCQGGAQ